MDKTGYISTENYVEDKFSKFHKFDSRIYILGRILLGKELMANSEVSFDWYWDETSNTGVVNNNYDLMSFQEWLDTLSLSDMFNDISIFDGIGVEEVKEYFKDVLLQYYNAKKYNCTHHLKILQKRK